MAFDFTGKKILVTGAGRGIGRALVHALVHAGGEVYALSLTRDNLDSLVEELPGVHPIQVDLSDWEATRREVDNIEPLDCLVNNAGIIPQYQSSLEVGKHILQDILDVNLMSAINVTQSVAKKMVNEDKGGSIVNVSSMNSLRAFPQIMPYCVSKAGLDMTTKQFALELGPNKIRVNAVNPTGVFTDMLEKAQSKMEGVRGIPRRTPLQRFAEVHEVVDLIMFLLNDKSTMITGTLNLIDGGLLSSIHV